VVYKFFAKLTQLRSAMVLRFGEPLDPFCNPVDDDGRSLAPSGRTVDPASYVKHHGVATVDPARDAGYTRELGEAIAREYQRETVILWTQLVAHVLYRQLVARRRSSTCSGVSGCAAVTMPRRQLEAEVGEARDACWSSRRRGGCTSGRCCAQPPERIVSEALTAWSGYHTRPVASTKGGDDRDRGPEPAAVLSEPAGAVRGGAGDRRTRCGGAHDRGAGREVARA
jgi:glycerol-3-phosphate O-acyltransferase